MDQPKIERMLRLMRLMASNTNYSIDELAAKLKMSYRTIYNSTSIVEYVDKKSNSANIKALSEAIKNKQKVKLIGYESARSETVKDRLVEPFAFSTNLIDVWAYDLGDLHNKVFKISRISEVETLNEDWEFEGSHRRQSTDVFRMSGKSPKRIKLRLGLRAKNLLLEEYPLAAKDITRKGAYWILETGVYDYAGVCRFYCGLADDIEILDSPELEDYVQEYIRRYIFR